MSNERPYSVHEGLDYVVILGPGHDTTENPLARVVDARTARMICEWLNFTDTTGKSTLPVLLLPGGLRWETAILLDSVARERLRQDAKWGGPSHDDQHRGGAWCHFIGKRITELRQKHRAPEQREQLFLEIAALALAAIESSKRLAVPPLPADVEPPTPASEQQ